MKRILIGLLALFPCLVHAQLAVIETSDTMLLSGSMLMTEAQPLDKLTFNQKGIAVYDDPTIKEKAQLQLDRKSNCFLPTERPIFWSLNRAKRNA